MYVFKPKQSRIILGEVAKQILKNQNTPLKQVNIKADIPEEEEETQVETGKPDYENMKYGELVEHATRAGLFKHGIKKSELISLLNGQS